MIVGYILYINIYIYCQVCASLGGYSIQLWNKLLTNKKAANPTDPPPLILDSVSSPLFHHKSSSRVFGEKRKKKCPSILSVAYITHHGAASESLHAHEDELKRKASGVPCWMVRSGPSSNKLLFTGEAGWSSLPPHTLQYSKKGTRDTHRMFVGFCFLIYIMVFLFCFLLFPYLFLFWSFHTYSWRIFKLFSKTRCRTSSSDWPIAASLVYFSGYRR